MKVPELPKKWRITSRQILLVIVVLCCLGLGWKNSQLRQLVKQQQDDQVWLSHLIQMRSSNQFPEASPMSAGELMSLTRRSLEKANLLKHLTSSKQINQQLEIAFTNISYTDGLTWLAEFRRNWRIRIVSLNARAKPQQPGNVDLKLTLRPGG